MEPNRESPFAFRVFVFGVEVTDDVNGYSVPRNDGRAAGRATITLANPWSRYTITPSDAALLYTGSAEAVDEALLDSARSVAAGDMLDERKSLFVRAKVGNVRTVNITAPTGAAAVPKKVLRWRFMAGGCIIHSGDPVRIFEMDEQGAWHYAFTGKVQSPVNTIDPSGAALVTLTCVDALGELESARVSFNPLVTDTQLIATTRDTVASTWFKDGYRDLPINEYIERLVFGYQDPRDGGRAFGNLPLPVHERFGAYGSSTEALSIYGAGTFDRATSQTSYFPNGVTLEDWQYNMDSRVSVDDLARLSAWPDSATSADASADAFALSGREGFLAPEAISADQLEVMSDAGVVDEWALVTKIGEHPELYPVDRGRILQLYPSEFEGQDTGIILRDIAGGPTFETESKTRLGIIVDVLARIDHSVYATAAGDIVIEMPLHTYDADRWGAFASRYTFDTMDIAGRLESGIDTSRLVTVVTTRPVVAKGYGDILQPDSLPPEVAIAYGLVGSYGARIERVPPRAHVSSPEGARALAAISLARFNGETDSGNYGIVPRIGLQPNRPAFLSERLEQGCIRSINWSVTVGLGDLTVSMSLGVNYIRRFAGGFRADGPPLLESVDGITTDQANWARLLSDVSQPQRDPLSATIRRVDREETARQSAASVQGTVDFTIATDALIQSIITGESGGRNVMGQAITPQGYTEPVRAIGIGQVLPRNVGPWSVDAGIPGAPITPAAFQADPDLQRRIVSYKLTQFYGEGLARNGGSSEEAVRFAAAAWNSGEGAARRGSGYSETLLDKGSGKSVKHYADNVVARWRKRVRAATEYATGEN